jgi:L-asparaginase
MINNEWRKINIITTGGTIEKTYDEFDGTLFNRETVIKNKLNQRLRLPYTEILISSLMTMDSLDMQDQDRVLIAEKIKELEVTDNVPIVVLHGTDSMQQSAETAHEFLKDLKVPVIFTGAMRPLGFEDSDALQNVTEALICAQILSPGVYISFHNRLFEVPGVRKNRDKRTFESFS